MKRILIICLALLIITVTPVYASTSNNLMDGEVEVVSGPGYSVTVFYGDKAEFIDEEQYNIRPMYDSFSYSVKWDPKTNTYVDGVSREYSDGELRSEIGLTQTYDPGILHVPQRVDLSGSVEGIWTGDSPYNADSISIKPTQTIWFSGSGFSISYPPSVSVSGSGNTKTFSWPTVTWNNTWNSTYSFTGIHGEADGITTGIAATGASGFVTFRFGSNAYGVTSEVKVNWDWAGI
ncbi:MAG: hypothetical protein PWQ68_2016 [Thermoanaerobacteraceae bacterium]|nr:hypothetical protein [Thermoanaerobacteraceae bacterium]